MVELGGTKSSHKQTNHPSHSDPIKGRCRIHFMLVPLRHDAPKEALRFRMHEAVVVLEVF